MKQQTLNTIGPTVEPHPLSAPRRKLPQQQSPTIWPSVLLFSSMEQERIWKSSYTLWIPLVMINIAMEKWSFIVTLPIKHGNFP